MSQAGPAAILLVDDRRENLLALEAVLGPLGHRLLMASSGEEALRTLLHEEVAVILLDVMMPGMDGFETAAQIKQREKTKDIPIVFLTAISREASDVMQGFSSGAVDYMTKPFEPWLLRAKVSVFVDLYEKSRILEEQRRRLAERLDEHYRNEARELRQLAEAALAINSTLSLGEMLQLITERAREIIGSHQAETLLLDDDGRMRSSSASYSSKYDAWAESGRGADLSAIFELVCRGQRPVRMSRRQLLHSPRVRELAQLVPGDPMFEGWLAVPLTGRSGRSFGVIQVADKTEDDFSESDESILVQLAQMASVAIENAELFEREHLIAETLQRRLLPERLPDVPGVQLAGRYQPGASGSAVGGDWYDAILLRDGSLALSVGDVLGRGAQAAAIMGQLRIALRAYAVQMLPPAEVLASLDRLLQGLSPSIMATAICLVLDPAGGHLRLACAGHPPPLLVKPCGEADYLTGGLSPPLGVMDEPSYEEIGVELDRGVTLLVYTDGLVEERTVPLDEGLERLRGAVTDADEPLESLCDRVLAHMVGDGKQDDVAMLAVRRV